MTKRWIGREGGNGKKGKNRKDYAGKENEGCAAIKGLRGAGGGGGLGKEKVTEKESYVGKG